MESDVLVSVLRTVEEKANDVKIQLDLYKSSNPEVEDLTYYEGYYRGLALAYESVINILSQKLTDVWFEELLNYDPLQPADFDILIENISHKRNLTYRYYKSYILNRFDQAPSQNNDDIVFSTNKGCDGYSCDEIEFVPKRTVINGADILKIEDQLLSFTTNGENTIATFIETIFNKSDVLTKLPSDDAILYDVRVCTR